MESIADTLSEAFKIQNGGWYRSININYLDFTFRNTNIWHYLSSNIRYMPVDLLSDCLHNIVEFQKRKKTAIHISIRDIYSGVLEMYRQKDATCVYNYYSGLERSGKALLIEHLRESDRREYNSWVSGSKKKVVLEYDDSILKIMEKNDYLSLLKMAYDMKSSANKIATQIITSETHIVLSSFMTLENNFDLMIISATNTDKNNLLIFSQTPLVWKDNEKWSYFCDPTYFPSSEFRAHWQLHRKLRAETELTKSCIVHCHSVDILDYVKPKGKDYRDIDSSLGVIKTTNWMPHGTEDFGDHIYNAMDQSDILAAIVEDHGIWIADHEFIGTIEALQDIVEFANKQMKIFD